MLRYALATLPLCFALVVAAHGTDNDAEPTGDPTRDSWSGGEIAPVVTFVPVATQGSLSEWVIAADRADPRRDGVVHGRLRGARLHFDRHRPGDAAKAVDHRTALRVLVDALQVEAIIVALEHDAPVSRTVRLDMVAPDEDGRVEAIALLESLIEQAYDGEGGWQVVNGRLEVGPKRFLARIDARRREVLDFEFLRERMFAVGPGGAAPQTARETREVAAAEVIARIATTVEPEAWVPDGALHAHLESRGEDRNPLAQSGVWASISWRDGHMIVTAPEFVLYRIRGPRAVVAPSDDSADRADRGVTIGAAAAAQRRSIALLRFEPSMSRTETEDAGLHALGRLWHARLRVDLEEVATRDAISMLASAVGVRIRAFWAEAPGDLGIEVDAPVSLRISDASGLEILELILGMTRSSAPSTWQLHAGSIEIGPRPQLARPSARRWETYPIDDLLLEAPLFGFGSIDDVVTPLERRHGRRLGMARGGGGALRRKSPEFIAAELLNHLERHVEPHGWIFADDQSTRTERSRRAAADPLQRVGTWVRARMLDGGMLITAPDFVHRQLAGYPALPSPTDSIDR